MNYTIHLKGDKIMNDDYNKTCCNCKWYDRESWCCEFELRTEAILDETRKARECKHYSFGNFNYEDAERSWKQSDQYQKIFKNQI